MAEVADELRAEVRQLRALVKDQRTEIERLRVEVHRHDPTACSECSGHPLG